MTPEETLAKAISQGYKEDFDGPGAKTPEQFLADGEKIAGVQSKLNKELTEKLEKLEETHKSTNQTLKEFMEQHHKATAEAFKRGYEKKLKDIKEKKIEAAAEADVEKVKALDKEEDDLRKNHKEAKDTPITPVIDPAFEEWSKENKWYKFVEGGGDEPSVLAEKLQELWYVTKPHLKGKKLYNEIKKYVALEYPEINGKKPVNKLDTSDHTNTPPKGKQEYANLPPEAKEMCDMFVKTQGITKEDYCKNFDWSSI
jgi:hypothetical protein